MKWEWAEVVAQIESWPGAVKYLLRSADAEFTALGYPEQVGQCQVADRVLVNRSALDKGLGTGGFALIVANASRLPAAQDGPGHVVKARYSPSQHMVLGVDEQESPHHELLRQADSISNMPVIAADLHSALPAIVAGIRHVNPAAKIAYIMSDGGALPVWFSTTAAALKAADHIIGTIAAGQAYGGDLEAVNIYSALLAARLVWRADIAIVTQGPGNLGTDTRWGFSGTGIGEALNAAHILQGQAIAALRTSQADPRERHRGISHHSMTVLQKVVTVPCAVVAPIVELEAGLQRKFADQLNELRNSNLQIVHQDTSGLLAALAHSPAPLRTMGRDLDADPFSFLSSAAAGAYGALRIAT